MSLIFKELRMGMNDKIFWIWKFRTMDKQGNVTKIGKLLRKTGLDEILQIINILKGDMTLVGPRPLNLSDHKKFRNFTLPIKPGITGWWQVHGRIQKEIGYYDLEYIYGKSWWFDLYIMWRTIPLVLLGKHG